MSKRLWEKGEGIDQFVHTFTVGNDPELDKNIVHFDALASAAHARMLESIGVLSKAECLALLSGLKEISERGKSGAFSIPYELEDCHTAIEAELTEKLGETGKKIHTARSRNDQVLVALRLFLRAAGLELLQDLAALGEKFFERARASAGIPMPGYTHFQPAMPASVEMWLHAFGESILDCARNGLTLVDAINTNPLGAAAGFGVPLPIDRELTTKLLGFFRTERNPIHIQNCRGQAELKFIRWASDIGAVLEKFAWDGIVYSTREFGFLSLPEELCTGSSIMPQKKNPDVLELLRGRVAKIRGAEQELQWVVAKLPSNYHRDFQYTKEPVIKALQLLREMIPVAGLVVEKLEFNEERLKAAMDDELYVTYEAYRLVRGGMSFREAYQETARKVKAGEISAEGLKGEFDTIREVMDLELEAGAQELKDITKKVSERTTHFSDLEEEVWK
ncbi:argininosuccinate lyase [Oligoflexia bacterium]|nr:argininosuccinate lyase [Oligoflexia bacterium]